jgi:hypothetical protein
MARQYEAIEIATKMDKRATRGFAFVFGRKA